MAELLVRANPVTATPEGPLGEVIDVRPDGFAWGLVERRAFLILVVGMSEQQAIDTYLAHRNGDPPITQITRFNPNDLPPPQMAKVTAYFDRFNQQLPSIAAASRPALVATLAQKLMRPLDASETAMTDNQLFAKFKREKWFGDVSKAHGLSFSAHRETAVADLPLPDKIPLNSGQVNRFTETIPYPVTPGP